MLSENKGKKNISLPRGKGINDNQSTSHALQALTNLLIGNKQILQVMQKKKKKGNLSY